MVEQSCPNCGKQYQTGDEVCRFCGLVFPFSTVLMTPGRILQGRYEIRELIHSGGMGYVYLAKDNKLYDRLCIVKQVREPVKSEIHQKKLEEEALRMAKLNHPNIAMIFDHFVEGGYYFLVVELIYGKTLSEVFKERNGKPTEGDVVKWAISMCDVVGYLHREGVIHRDISPDNIMLTEEGAIKFIDFGTLRELRYTASGGTAGMGKYGYTPPEQWQGKPEVRSDVFALGATIYYLLTGFLPLSKEYLIGQAPQRGDFYPNFPPIRTKNTSVSPQLEAILQRALQLDVNSRFSSATEFGQALRSLGQVEVQRMPPLSAVAEQVAIPLTKEKRQTKRRLPKSAVADEEPSVAVAKPAETGKQHPVWFWLGLALFAGAEVTGWSVFISLAASGGRQPPAGNEAIFIISSLIILLGVLLMRLSRRKLRHGWFWPGAAMFIYGIGTIPMWTDVCLDIANFPNVPHDVGGFAALIGVSCIPFIIGGASCLWKGWPRIGVKHPRRELFSFISTLSVICLVFILGIPAGPGASVERDILSFSDSFDSGVANGWKLGSGWQVKNDNGNYVLAGKGQDYQWAWPRVSQASAYILEADFELLDYGSELRFNTMYSQGVGVPNRYIVGVQEGKGVYLAKECVSNSTRNYADLDKGEANITLKQWHHIKIAVGGGIIKVYLDGELKMEYWDETPFPSGSFTIETGKNSFAYVDNIVVKPNTEPVSKNLDILSFTDNFEDGAADGWQLDSGWQVVNDNGNYVLNGQGQDYQNAWPRITSAENYILEADFEILSGLFEFAVRYSESDKSSSHYVVWVYQDRVNLGKNVSKSLLDLSSSPADIGFKQWHTISIALEKKNIRVYVDHELKIDYWDSEPLPAGSFRIMSHPGSQVCVDNILVKPYADSTSAPPPAPLPPPLPNGSK